MGFTLSFPFGNGSIDQLINLFDETECQRDLFGFCKRGTVVVDPWTNYALATQRNLVRDLPIDQILFIGTHNSFNNRADGYGFGDLVLNDLIKQLDSHARFIWAQQEYTMTDQLNMGIRELHLDPHWYGSWPSGAGSWLSGSSNNLRLCHGAGNITFINRIIGDIESSLNITIYFDSEQLGCSPLDRLYYDGLLEIRQWQLNNPGEFLFIHQDDSEGATYNNTQTTIQMIQDVFKETIFTPIDFYEMFNSTWPSIRELVNHNKTIMWQSENDYGAGDGMVIFKPLLWPSWPNNCLKDFSQEVDRNPQDQRSRVSRSVQEVDRNPQDQRSRVSRSAQDTHSWLMYQGESQIVGSLYDGSQSCGLLIPDNIPLVLNYNISVLELDQVSPILMKSFVWTWATYEPATGCPYWNSSNGRWYTDDCSSNYSYLCRRDTQLVISSEKGSWGNSSCPLGSFFSVFHSKYESNTLMFQLENNERIWINYTLD